MGLNIAGKITSRIMTTLSMDHDPRNEAILNKYTKQITSVEAANKKSEAAIEKANLSIDENTRKLIKCNTTTKKGAKDVKKYSEQIKKERNVVEAETMAIEKRNRGIKKATIEIKRADRALRHHIEYLTKTQIATMGFASALATLSASLLTGIKLNIEYIENLNVINQLFGDNTDAVISWAKSTRNSFGLARVSALKYVAILKAFTKSSGMSDAAGTGISLIGVQLAADLASFRNVSFDTAFRAIVSGLAGISRTLRYNFGIDIGQEALAERFGHVGATQKEKMIQRFILLLEHSQFVVGDFSRTKNSPANQLKLLRENFKEFTFLFSQTLLPMVNIVLILLNKMLSVLIKTQKIIVIFGGALAIGNMIRGLTGGLKGLAMAATLGIPGFGGFAIAGLQALMASLLIGMFVPNISKKAVQTPQESDSYLPGYYGFDENGQIQLNDGVTINIAGDATQETVEEMAFEAKKMRFGGSW